MSEIRRGSAAIQEAAESSGRGGVFRPYLPQIFWKDDKEERFVLFLNEIESIPLFDMVGFIPTGPDGKFFAETVAKTDQFFGERSDAFEKEWDATIRPTNVGIAVELEPLVEVVNKRRRPRGFEVKTVEYERTILDEDGESTDQKETVTAPAVGYIAQSPNNYYNVLANYDASEAPITSTPLKITRIGKDKHTSYTVTGYEDQPLDLSNLFAYLDGISYLREEMDDLVDKVADLDEAEGALLIGTVLLDKRIEELLDPDRYDELLDGVTESMDKFGNKKGKGKKTERAAKPSQRRAREEEPADDSDDGDDEPAAEEPKARKAAPKAKAKASSKTTAKSSGSKDRMAELRARAEKARAAKKAA